MSRNLTDAICHEGKIDAPLALDDLEHFIEQYGARQNRKCWESDLRTTGGRAALPSGSCIVIAACVSSRFIRLAMTVGQSCNACCGSLPVALRGRRSTMSNGRGRNTGSIRWRSCSVKAATLRSGATTTAPRRATPVEPLRLAQKERAVDHARNGVELRIQIAERAALAGDVDQVGGPAVQQEFLVAGDLDDIAASASIVRRDRRARTPGRSRAAGERPATGAKRPICAVRRMAICPVSVEP